MIVKNKNKKIVVAMSGGVDSSVAAALLKRAGFNVIGVFMKFWSPNYSKAEFGTSGLENRCCSPEAETRARKVASILDIPFYVFDFQKEFKKKVVDYFLKECWSGRTPNPCIVCNKQIKFGLLLERALALDADYIATGHYAKKVKSPAFTEVTVGGQKLKVPEAEQVRYEADKTTTQKSKVFYKLLKGRDGTKDQSYFLWQLNQKQLSRILFPIGDYIKGEVRKLAKKFKLPVLDVKESMDICFIQTTINNFLKKYLKTKSGPIICSRSGLEQKVVGKHEGLWLYTVGQRKGIGLAGGPYFVLDKDAKNNVLIVTKNEKDLYKKELICKNVNWISGKKPPHQNKFGAGQAELPLRVRAKIRYQHSPASATLTSHLSPCTSHLIFDKAQRAITPGQSVVFYKRNEVLGGGVICQSKK